MCTYALTDVRTIHHKECRSFLQQQESAGLWHPLFTAYNRARLLFICDCKDMSASALEMLVRLEALMVVQGELFAGELVLRFSYLCVFKHVSTGHVETVG